MKKSFPLEELQSQPIPLRSADLHDKQAIEDSFVTVRESILAMRSQLNHLLASTALRGYW